MINKSFLTAVLLLIALPFMAQPKKTFTLDDLLSGGSNFWNLQPKNLHTTWWGDVLVELDVDECRQISDAKGRSVYPKFLFTLDELNAAAGLDDKNKVRSLYYASFPDGERKEVFVRTSRENLIYDWGEKKVVWRQPRVAGATHADLSLASRCEAYVRDWNLYVMTADGAELAVTTDGTAPAMPFDLFRAARDTALLQQSAANDPFILPAGKLLSMITIDAARAIGREADLGSLEVGKLADITTIKMMSPHLMPRLMPIHQLMLYGNPGDVADVFVAGKALMRDRRVLTVSEEDVFECAETASREAIRRAGCEHLLAPSDNFWTGAQSNLSALREP